MKIAGVQMDVALGDVAGNLDRFDSFLRETVGNGAALTIFPECAVTGYCFDSLEQCGRFAQTIPGPATDHVAATCQALQCYAVFGMLEADGDRVFNAAVLVGPEGLIGSYRKVHLPYLGVDMLTTPGDRPFAVHHAGHVRVGMNICYDAAFPEAARSLALLGADLIALPTNWPPGAECMAANSIATRAMENGVYYAAINRVGTEGGFPFIGSSSICGPNGKVLAAASAASEEILYAEIDVTLSRRKHIVRVENKHEINRLADRRPEMYTLLTEPHTLPTPRAVHAG
ncbi:MAG: carbon-nitrogen hydrolase family protein [Planctomycetaceae bacterium]|nr:carbon-nitrogen hydrolase family protein [Planctomycetaceae bacterium]